MLLMEREKQLLLQQQQLKVSDSMAEEVSALARRCKIYEQKARRLTTMTQSLATKQMGFQAMSSFSGSVDDIFTNPTSSSSHRRTSSRLNKKVLEEKIDRLEATYDLQHMPSLEDRGKPEDQDKLRGRARGIPIDSSMSGSSSPLFHRRHESLNIDLTQMRPIPSEEDDDLFGQKDTDTFSDLERDRDSKMTVKDRIMKRKMMLSGSRQPSHSNSNSSTSNSTATVGSGVSRIPRPTAGSSNDERGHQRTRSNVSISWGPVEVNNIVSLDPSPEPSPPSNPNTANKNNNNNNNKMEDEGANIKEDSPESHADLLGSDNDTSFSIMVQGNSHAHVINDLTHEFLGTSVVEEVPSVPVPPSSAASAPGSAKRVSYSEEKARLAPTPTRSASASKTVRARLLDVLADMDCQDDEKFEKLQLLFEIRSLNSKK